MHLCAHGGQRKALDPSVLELQLFVGLLAYHMNAGTQTLVLRTAQQEASATSIQLCHFCFLN